MTGMTTQTSIVSTRERHVDPLSRLARVRAVTRYLVTCRRVPPFAGNVIASLFGAVIWALLTTGWGSSPAPVQQATIVNNIVVNNITVVREAST